MNSGSLLSFSFMLSKITPACSMAFLYSRFLPSSLPFLWHITSTVLFSGCFMYFSSASVCLMF